MTNSSLSVTSDSIAAINLVKDEVDKKIDRSLSIEKQEAQENHFTFVEVAKLGKSAGLALRDKAKDMWLTKGYLELEVPYPGSPENVLMFDTFEGWLNFAVEEAGLSDSTSNSLKLFIQNIVDPVAKRLIVSPSTGLPYEISDVTALRELHTQKLASAARRTLRDETLSEDEKYERIGALIEIASDPTVSGDDFVERLRSKGLTNRRNSPFEVKLARAEGKTAYLIVIDEKLEPQVNTALEGRGEFKSRTVDDLVSDLMAISITDVDVSGIDSDMGISEASDSDVQNWLGEM